jgi:transposase-like protein
MDDEPTSIQISKQLWKELNGRKEPGDTFEDVIWRMVEGGRQRPSQQDNPQPTPTPPVEADPYADLSFPQGVDRDEALAAIETAVAYVREEHDATKQEIVRAVMPDHELKYDYASVAAKLDAGDRYRGAWWRKVIKRGLEATPEIAKPKPGHSEWRWVGEDG